MDDLIHLQNTPPWEWPANAAGILADTLRNPQAASADRLLAAELAGSLPGMDDSMADLLQSVVASPGEQPGVRARAAISLGPLLEETGDEGFDEPYSEPPIRQETFQQIQQTLHEVYMDEHAPIKVRRRALEASVRARQDWHADAIRRAYANPNEDWKLTAVFCMQYASGFDEQIVAMLKSRNSDIHYEAVRAAGAHELKAAWPHIAKLVVSKTTGKRLLLAAIEAAAEIDPRDAGPLLVHLADSSDPEIAEAANEAMGMAEIYRNELNGEDEDKDEDDEEDEDFPA